MPQALIETQPSAALAWTRNPWARLGVGGALALLLCVVLPLVPILVGVLLIGLAVVHMALPRLQPLVEAVLRVPVAGPAKRRARVLLAAGAGVVLVATGSAGATLRGHVRSAWQQRSERQEFAEQDAQRLLQRAREQLDAGNVGNAEFALLGAQAVPNLDPDTRAEVDDLLDRLRRSGDTAVILAILKELPDEEFQAFERASALPAALDFGDEALNARAVTVALEQLDEARRARSRRG